MQAKDAGNAASASAPSVAALPFLNTALIGGMRTSSREELAAA
jgi:hypothetical protein